MGATALVIQLSALITALTAITAVLKKQVTQAIRDMDYNNCKTYLTDFLADVSQGIPKTEIQRLRACEVYQHYMKDLKGNTYVEKEWNRLMK